MTSRRRDEAPARPVDDRPEAPDAERPGDDRWQCPLRLVVPAALTAVALAGGGTYVLTHLGSGSESVAPVVVRSSTPRPASSTRWDVADPARPHPGTPVVSPAGVPTLSPTSASS